MDSQLLVIPMVEETEAVNNLDAILKVSGVDVLHVASSDLGQSMGNPGAAAVRQVMRELIPRIRAGGKLVVSAIPERRCGLCRGHQARSEIS